MFICFISQSVKPIFQQNRKNNFEENIFCRKIVQEKSKNLLKSQSNNCREVGIEPLYTTHTYTHTPKIVLIASYIQRIKTMAMAMIVVLQ